MKEPLYLKISIYNFAKNSRDARELRSAEVAGFKNIVVLSSIGQRDEYFLPNWKYVEVKLNRYGTNGIKNYLVK